MQRRSLLSSLALTLLAACGDDGQREPTATAGPTTAPGTTADTTAAGTTTDAATTTPTGGGTTSTGPGPGTTTAGTTTDADTTVAETTTGTTAEATTSSGLCDPRAVSDTKAFTFAAKFDTGIPDKVLQASFYNGDLDEVVIMSFSGKARRFQPDGTPKGDVFDVPAAALPKLDGATYDAKTQRGLLINQDCKLVEVDAASFAVVAEQPLGFGMSICAGLALGLDDNLYIASYGTNELVVLSRDGLQEVRRVDMPAVVGLTGFDGIALIAGSENFLVMSTAPDARAAIIDPLGTPVVPTAALGQDQPPMLGGMPMLPDAVLTLCGNGHAWVCEAYDATCFDYVPDDGDKNACACLIPQ